MEAVMVKVATEVWIATALLHCEHPERTEFTTSEILDRVKTLKLTPEVRPGVQVHISTHCVANRDPNPARLRMLYEPQSGTRRLYRPGDRFNSGRTGGAEKPSRADVPPEYHYLLDWYEQEYARPAAPGEPDTDPLLSLCGLGKGVYGDPDEYVRQLREGWE